MKNVRDLLVSMEVTAAISIIEQKDSKIEIYLNEMKIAEFKKIYFRCRCRGEFIFCFCFK